MDVSCAPKMMPPARIDFPSVKGGKSYEEAVHGRARSSRSCREAESGGKTVAQLARQHSVSEPTIYGWRNKYGGMEQAEVRRLRELEKENAPAQTALLAERDGHRDRRPQGVPQKKVGPAPGTPGSGPPFWNDAASRAGVPAWLLGLSRRWKNYQESPRRSMM